MTNSLNMMVLKHLSRFKKITSQKAFEAYGITRLSACIYELRAQGYPIETDMVDDVNRYGNPTKYAIYRVPSDWKLAAKKK